MVSVGHMPKMTLDLAALAKKLKINFSSLSPTASHLEVSKGSTRLEVRKGFLQSKCPCVKSHFRAPSGKDVELIPLFLELASKALEEPRESSVHALGDTVLDWDIKRSL